MTNAFLSLTFCVPLDLIHPLLHIEHGTRSHESLESFPIGGTEAVHVRLHPFRSHILLNLFVGSHTEISCNHCPCRSTRYDLRQKPFPNKN